MYAPGEGGRYRLCAEFATDTRGEAWPGGRADEGWRHPAGRHCFERVLPAEAARAPAVD